MRLQRSQTATTNPLRFLLIQTPTSHHHRRRMHLHLRDLTTTKSSRYRIQRRRAIITTGHQCTGGDQRCSCRSHRDNGFGRRKAIAIAIAIAGASTSCSHPSSCRQISQCGLICQRRTASCTLSVESRREHNDRAEGS